MENKLPKNWVKTEVQELFIFSYGKGIPTSDLTDTGYDVYGANGIIGKYPTYMFDDQKIIISCRGAASGAIHKTKVKSVVTSNSIVFNEIYEGKINIDYIKYIMSFVDKTEIITGTAQPQITIQLLNKLNIPLPPLAEQKRIADKLDILFGQLETIRKATDHIPELIKNFRQQILTYAVTGHLTYDWRQSKNLHNGYESIKISEHREYSNNLPKTWVLLSFADVVCIESHLVNPNDYQHLPLIAPDNIESMTGKIISKPTVLEVAPISPKHHFYPGVLIYSKIRPYLSKIAYADFEGLCSADMYPLKTHLNIFYLYYYMLSGEFLSYATTAGERSVLPKINQKGLNIIPIPVPSEDEQTEIVKRVQSIFEKVDIIEQRYQTLKTKLENLPQALLHKAFKGELVEQLPTDGNAADLLREIEQLKKSLKKK
ncbi:restriction endonuclease subunit S [Bacteroides sp.]|uniref:restriction endonuclease subunit S n=1 Tax=Bacteroides sp. TaxID=29523 RepID=UPI002FC661A4